MGSFPFDINWLNNRFYQLGLFVSILFQEINECLFSDAAATDAGSN
jgi:hypothetical protein